jgi:putative ABC transport system permease protein
MLQDLRYALRTLARSPGFTAVAVVTLALGIGGTATMFGVLDALLLRPPAGVQDADEVVRLYVVRRSGTIQTPRGGAGSYPDYDALRANARGFADLAAFYFPRDFDVDRGESAQRVRGLAVSGNFFSLLGVRAARGRVFLGGADDAPGAPPVTVLSHGFWQRRFGGHPDAVGRPILVNGQMLTVIGVAPRDFVGLGAEPIDLWVPVAMSEPLGLQSEDWRTQPFSIWLNFVGRLAPGAQAEQAAAGAAVALRHAAEGIGGLDQNPGVIVGPLNAARGPYRPKSVSLALWLGLVTGIVLLIAAANVANLLLARAATRRREIGVRVALGASGARLIRQLATESVLLALLGGMAGLLLAAWGGELARQFPIPLASGRPDARMIGFALAVSLATGLLFGLAPALQAARTDPATAIKAAEPRVARGPGQLRMGLVTFQIALSVALLIGAGLFIRSLNRVLTVDAGVDVDRVLVASVNLVKAGYDEAARETFYGAALARLRALPGVERASLARFAPLGGAASTISFHAPGAEQTVIDEGPYENIVTPGFFETVGMQLRGRDFTERDRTGSPPVAVVNETMGRIIAPGGDALGACIPLGVDQVRKGGCTEIIGVARDARHRYLNEKIVPYVFQSAGQHPLESFVPPTILVRTRSKPEAMVRDVHTALQGMAANLPHVDVQRMEALIRRDVLPFRIGARLFTLFGVLALVLAAVGLAGVLSYLVTQRTHEIGVRLSLGAARGDVVRLVVLQGMRPVGLGLGIGLLGAYAGTRLLASLLYGVSARDPLTFVAVPATLVAVALLASWLPAHRATKVDPMVALRSE